MAEQDHGLFGWTKEGTGLTVNVRHTEQVAHEALFEDDYTAIKDRPMYLGLPFSRRRFIFWSTICAVLVAGLLARAFWMQIVHGGVYAARAEGNRLRVEVIPAPRGVIRDRDGVVLADNVPSFDIMAVPWLLPHDPAARDARLADIARTAGVDTASMEDVIASSTDPTQEIVLKRNIPYDRAIALQVMLGNDPAVRVAVGSKRDYPLSGSIQSLSHILGYVGNISQDELAAHVAEGYRQTDLFGKSGVESSYESQLRGQPGLKEYEVDAHDQVTSLVEDNPPKDGTDLVLSISSQLQLVTEQALRAQLVISHTSSGSAVVMDPRDGSILAAVSIPTYDDNVFSGGVSSTVYQALLADPEHPLVPRVWAGIFPSGSTIKPTYAVGALTEGVITPDTTVDSVGGIRVGGILFPDWKAGGHGITNVRKAIADSVNTFFYTIGGGYNGFVGLGIDRLDKWLRIFGFGSKTGIDVPGEQAGFVPTKEWKFATKGVRWYVGDSYNLSIGQGDLLVTPLQIERETAAMANSGHLVTPHFLYGLGDKQVVFPFPQATVAPDADIQVVREGMRDTVTYGSGHALVNFPVPVAGKTGTAQWRTDKRNHAWFTAFAPYDKPEVAVTVMIEEGVEGATNSVPVAKKILNEWYAERQAGRL